MLDINDARVGGEVLNTLDDPFEPTDKPPGPQHTPGPRPGDAEAQPIWERPEQYDGKGGGDDR